MNKEIANVLKRYIETLPFVDLIGGLVQMVRIKTSGMDDNTIEKRIPVSYDTVKAQSPDPLTSCLGMEREFIPNSSRASIIYFEDYGTTPKRTHPELEAESKLRIVVWLNKEKLVGDRYKEITGAAIAMILKRLPTGNPINDGMFTRLRVVSTYLPIQDAGLFAKYTYDEVESQYLRPPFEYFAIDVVVNYSLRPGCIDEINWNDPKTC